MEKTVYCLTYPNGKFVRRDDSTGPMSTGGYPYPVDSVDQATFWSSDEEASRYMGSENFNLHRVIIDYAVSGPMPRVDFWERCNHNCAPSPLALKSTALHYLDCRLTKK